ncbi:MAG: ribbon-helix-helix protein, CopG family [Actinobacteria bacterium]|nr:ribbon-helix-helix protein, CopG family [Actinomycetota bacterium]MBU4358474.1 ribbon-helix-helix protein, CopG family [Actinomycetota bacterium]MBU4392491.1 ribbon-helix-helix protein, CopG family [Actinomycetota bacterium]MBU4441537.1 ribbon-helix-helix protein, CopG family [Actinomycetota bacterium]
MSRTTKTMTVSLPPQVYEEVEKLAREENKTKSELFREMVRVYEEYLDERRWRRLKRAGDDTATRLQITSEADIERIVHEARGIRE